MTRFLYACICVVALAALSACGGGDTNQPADGNTPSADTGGDACGDDTDTDTGTDGPDEEPKEDPYKYRKIKADAPEGWHRLGNDGVFELQKPEFGLFTKVQGHELITKYSDVEHPHASSGTDEEWEEWRETVSAVLIYNVAKTPGDPVASLEEMGAEFIDGFDPGAVREQQGVAVYIHPDDDSRWLACVSNDNGVYVLDALVRSDGAGEVLKPYPMTIEAE